MKVTPIRPTPAFRDYITHDEFARESGLSKEAIRCRAERNLLQRRWQEKHCSPTRRGRWLYWVGHLPEASGSSYLIDHLTKEVSRHQRLADDARERLDRAVLQRRARRAA